MLHELLGYLRALALLHQTLHWNYTGKYGDHLLFQRMYEAIGCEVDTLAEKIIGGGECLTLDSHVANIATALPHMQGGCPIATALQAERGLQHLLKVIYDAKKADGSLSLGMDDFLMATANAHETNLYLLQQRGQLHSDSAGPVGPLGMGPGPL